MIQHTIYAPAPTATISKLTERDLKFILAAFTNEDAVHFGGSGNVPHTLESLERMELIASLQNALAALHDAHVALVEESISL
jgi:hypothetical protein